MARHAKDMADAVLAQAQHNTAYSAPVVDHAPFNAPFTFDAPLPHLMDTQVPHEPQRFDLSDEIMSFPALVGLSLEDLSAALRDEADHLLSMDEMDEMHVMMDEEDEEVVRGIEEALESGLPATSTSVTCCPLIYLTFLCVL
jgi:hypothetical protein